MANFLDKLKKGMGEEDLSFKLDEKPAPKKRVKKAKVEEKAPTIKEETPVKKIEVVKEERDKEVKKEEKKEQDWFEIDGQLTVDVYQTNGDIVIQSAVAGIKPEDLDIIIENDIVLIRGERQNTAEKEGKNYFYQECYWGRFSREIILPAEVDSSRAKAVMKEGVLTIRIPKIEKEKKRIIEVKE